MSEIKEFWEVKHLYKTPAEIIEKITEFYSADFIENYSKWKDNVNQLNLQIKTQLFSKNFPEKFWKEMEYDWFCKNMISLINEWVKVNSNIERYDIIIIFEKLCANYIAGRLTEWNEQMYSIQSMMESIKKAVKI